MSERPRKLPTAATFVIWASRELSLAEKVVWYHDWALDQGGPDASYISNASMARRLGLKPRGVEQARNRLKLLGLHEPIRRRDARNLGWVSTLPGDCRPQTLRAAGSEAEALAATLDAHVRQRDRWRTGQCSGTAPASAPGMHRPVQAGAAALGGRGETPASESRRKPKLQPQSQQEDGVGASAPEPEDGGPEGFGRNEPPKGEAEAHGWEVLRARLAERRKAAGLA